MDFEASWHRWSTRQEYETDQLWEIQLSMHCKTPLIQDWPILLYFASNFQQILQKSPSRIGFNEKFAPAMKSERQCPFLWRPLKIDNE